MTLSIVIPLYNEEKNIEILYGEIKEALRDYPDHEIIAVDDGSSDQTLGLCRAIHGRDKQFKVIALRRNYGQSSALAAGFDHASGDVIVSMDGDLQNDPADIPRLLDKLNEGYDAISGWRYDRKDKFAKRVFSLFGRLLRRIILKDFIHDSGCTLKAYKKEAIKSLELMGEMHRYIAQILIYNGYKVGELKVNHRQRSHGKTKYSLRKLPRGFLDLLIIFYQQKYATRPIHFFGGIGLLSMIAGFVLGIYLIIIKYAYGEDIDDRPLLLLAVLLLIIGIQFIILGIISDIMVRIYYREGHRSYNIEEVIED